MAALNRLQGVFTRIITTPSEQKYRNVQHLKLAFQSKFEIPLPGSIAVLIAAGFHTAETDHHHSVAGGTGDAEPHQHLVFSEDDTVSLQFAAAELQREIDRLIPAAAAAGGGGGGGGSAIKIEPAAPPVPAPTATSGTTASSTTSIYKKKKITSTHPAVVGVAARHKPVTKISRDQMAAKLEKRLAAAAGGGGSGGATVAADIKSEPAPASTAAAAAGSGGGEDGKIRRGKVTDFVADAKLRAEVAAMRRDKHQHWRMHSAHAKKRVYTTNDLAELRDRDMKARANFKSDYSGDTKNKRSGSLADFEDVDPHKLGLEALKLTNEFRARQSPPLPPLTWHQKLADIGLVHSKDMGDGRVPFSHVGADKRFASYPMAKRACAENLAMSHGLSNAAKYVTMLWVIARPSLNSLLVRWFVCCA